MYDGLTGHYTFACPATGEARVRLSSFLALERLPGAAHPVVYKVAFRCRCGDEHEGLVTHDELDWAPLTGGDVSFFNVMTQRLETAALELVERAAERIRAGEWPWSFFCYHEDRARPVFPSAFQALAPADERVGVAVRCPACARLSLNVVSPRHVDEPFYSDARVGVVEHVFSHDVEPAVSAFREELASAAFDARRRLL
ncbi:MAG: hypothetical protein KY396_05215 [Actinobacteria bacterium]|nr:hypothetical protein [Actinomycetota bacterium]